MNELRFINDILKPWDELNELLVQQYAFQPDLSDITRMAGNIAVSIRHQIDFSELNDKQACELSLDHKLMTDAGDYYKHGSLKKPDRNCPMYVAATFEYKDDQFAFLRNIITLEHASLGENDFMQISSSAAKFWIMRNGFKINWPGLPKIATKKFEHSASLKFDSKYCINMASTRIKMFKADSQNNLQPYDPPEVRFAVF